MSEVAQWSVFELELNAHADHDWWTFPVRVVFVHEEGTEIAVEGFWDGNRTWRVRFAAPLFGEWTWTTESDDAGLDGHHGQLDVQAPSFEAIEQNPNLRGQIRIRDNGRYFEYADGTPFFMLGDTLWAGNSARCGLGEQNDGPFFQYMKDRKSKGFTTILMQYMRGFGDTTNERAGQRNEGGYPFIDENVAQLNPAYFQILDVRMHAIWEDGWVMATPITWWGKTGSAFFSLAWAKRISAYLMVRYGAFNQIWSLSGEYQYAMKDCGWTEADVDALGDAIQTHNAFGRPVSIHPSGRTDWPAPHDALSSRPFHESAWLDHHWLQTGQQIDRMYYIPIKCEENRALSPIRPVFCSEAHYERPPSLEPEGGYHARWQAWAAFLSGACGYGYGAFGLWQFYDPGDPKGETGKQVKGVTPWPDAMAFEGSSYLAIVRKVLTQYPWWDMQPCRERLLVDGNANVCPSADDLAPPYMGMMSDDTAIVYIPRGNAGREIALTGLMDQPYRGVWIDPRGGDKIESNALAERADCWLVPVRPDPVDEDWVLILERV